MRHKLAYGIFMWVATERRTARYGYVFPAAANFDDSVTVTTFLDHEVADTHAGRRVRLTARVIESRASGHAGDRFYGLFPSTPEIGEEIGLGVGTFDVRTCPTDAAITEFGLIPGDGREELWIDPRPLYRLHDQTVDIFVEETDEDFSPAPELSLVADPDKAISNGDGTMQFRSKVHPVTKIRAVPKFESLGDGLFVMHAPGFRENAGEEIEIEVS